MQTDLLSTIAYIFIIVLLFDVSFNMRRLQGNLDRVWRKLAEINDAIKKNNF